VRFRLRLSAAQPIDGQPVQPVVFGPFATMWGCGARRGAADVTRTRRAYRFRISQQPPDVWHKDQVRCVLSLRRSVGRHAR
jgi:hypothetical protein